MAKKKQKPKNKYKQKKQIKKFFSTIFVLLIIAAAAFFCYKAVMELQGIKDDVINYDYSIPSTITEDLQLPKKVGEKIEIEWTSSNTSVISNDGKVTFPSFEDGDVEVKLVGKVKITFEELLSGILYEIIGTKIEDFEQTVIVPAKLATDEDKVKTVIDRLSLIEETYASISLPTTLCFESIKIYWESSNTAVLSNDGKVTTPSSDTTVKVQAKVESNGYIDVKQFDIKILSKPIVLEVVDDSFDNQAATSKYDTIKSTSGVTYYNARIMEEEGATSDDSDLNATVPSFIRLRNKDENNGSFSISDIVNPTKFSFKFKFAGSQKTESSKLVIKYITETKTDVIELTVKHLDDFMSYVVDLSLYEKVSIIVEHVEDWSSDTYLDIDDVTVLTSPSITNLEQWVINNTPTQISKSLILPFTTSFGGEVTWESSNSDLITKDGVVNRNEDSKTVTLTANITYLGESSKITIEVVIKGKASVQALEIFFIDIGKYGAGDCGECTYIKFGDIDIIVDAGDHFESTVQAITEAINQRLEDNVIEYVIATHPDGDHIGGMASLFEAYEIKTLIKFEGKYGTQKYQKLETAYINEGCEVYDIQSDIISQNKGDKFITLSNDVFISFVDTKYYTSEESNGKSIVFTLEAYGTRVLMTGDADNATGHTDLENKYKDQVGDIDILKVVHHGTGNGTTMEYLNTVDPEVAIICNGNYLGNKHGHPHPTALKNLYTYDSNIKVYAITGGGTIDGVANKTNNTYKCSSEDRFNQRNGLITLIIDNNGYTLSSEYYGNNILEINQTTYYQSIVANGLG